MTKQKVLQVPNLEIRKSPIAGVGVFANKDIHKGQTILFLSGEEMTTREILEIIRQGKERKDDPLQIEEERYIDVDEFPRCVNHSCSPNSFIKGKNELVALKDIKKNEEVTFDYSTTMDDNPDEWSGFEINIDHTCSCGSKNCRKVIGEFRELPKEVQESYLKNCLVPDFIQRKFQKTL